MKIHEWLAQAIDSHDIANHEQLAKDFKEKTGHEASWSSYSVGDTQKAIDARGIGGHVAGDINLKTAWGYQVAIDLARKYVPTYRCTKMGRGFAYREALDALREAGV